MMRRFVAAAAVAAGCTAYPAPMAPRPPMGGRFWNSFGRNIDQVLFRKIIDGFTSRSRSVDGTPTSLLDLGYKHLGITDGWQACGTGYQKSFHAEDGTPLINASLWGGWDDIKKLVSYGHGKGVLMGWYTINCICLDTYIIQRSSDKDWARRVYEKEIELLVDAGFDGIKIDNCGDDQGIGFQMLTDNINKSGHPMLIENCDQGHTQAHRSVPTDPHGTCYGDFFRTGGDIRATWGSVMTWLQKTIPYQDLDAPISRPNCWAYPDMLEVGNFDEAHNVAQSRTHFGAWCIVSSPLYLGFDVTNDKEVDAVWDVISNKEAIAVNQAWAGHPGRLVHDNGTYQVWAKKMEDGGQAVLAFSKQGDTVPSLALSLRDLGLAAGPHAARDIWARKNLSAVDGTWHVPSLGPYESVFVRFAGSDLPA